MSHFTVIIHIAKFWQLIGAVPWYGSDLGYSYSLWLLGDVPVIHGVVLLPALQAFLLQDSFLQPLHLNGRLKKKERKKEKKRKSVASRPKTRGAAQHHNQATSAPPQSSILALQESTVPVSVTTPKVLTIAPPPRLGGGGHHLRGLRVASELKSAHKLTCR